MVLIFKRIYGKLLVYKREVDMDYTITENTEAASTKAYNCPNCGAELKFNPNKNKLCCEFCESEFSAEEIENKHGEDTGYEKQKKSEEYCNIMNEFCCPNCGAEILSDDDTAADICVYCQSPVVHKGKLSGQMMPDKIIPFRYGKKEAESRFRKFASAKWFVPSSFKSKKHADLIRGVYYPFWVTDADTYSELSANCTRIRVWRSGNTEFTETSRYNVVRGGSIHFEDIVTSAYSKSDKEMLEGVLPYPSSSLIPFSMAYLSGFKANKRDIERDAVSDEVKSRMKDYADTLLSATISGYTGVTKRSLGVNVHSAHWEYSLMPIWILNYVTPKKTYKYAMNGDTGKIYGELPVSPKKVLIACAAVFAVVAPIVGLIGGMFL